MRPIRNLPGCLGITAALLLVCGFLASKMPVTMVA